MDRSADASINRDLWTRVNHEFTDARADEVWQRDEITWGIFDIPEAELGVLGDVEGLDVVELGCGTAYFSARLARLGAHPVGVDLTTAQLDSARRCQREYGPVFPLVEADAEDVPLPDAGFDLVISEYGASLWCDPRRWVKEAARLLRPGGRLVFLTSSVLVTLCVPADEGYATTVLQRPQRGQDRLVWPGGGVEHHPPHGDWIQVLARNGFVVEALHELFAPVAAADVPYYEIAHPDWAQRWPVEDLWVARAGGSCGSGNM